MNKWLTIGTIALVVALAAGLALSSTALAQGPGPDNGGYGAGFMNGRRGPDSSLVAVAAKTLGLTQAELVAQLNQGQTFAQVAQAHGKSVDDLAAAFIASRAAQLQANVAAGAMTQAQADAMISAMKVNITARLNAPFSPRGYGSRAGFVDANGDGVCDLQAGGQGMRHGGRWNP